MTNAPVKRYIAGQAEHHRKEDFKSELFRLLRAHEVEFDCVTKRGSADGFMAELPIGILASTHLSEPLDRLAASLRDTQRAVTYACVGFKK